MRKPRLEIQGGLYHIITRGNNRQLIFGSDDDRRKFLLQLAHQKARLPFYLYAYCLMPNHIHLLIERQDDSISRIMQRLLTAYSQYHTYSQYHFSMLADITIASTESRVTCCRDATRRYSAKAIRTSPSLCATFT